MHVLSLKLNEEILVETDKIVKQAKMSRNAYINEALRAFNAVNRRRMVKGQLVKESKLVAESSMDVLREMDEMIDDNKL